MSKERDEYLFLTGALDEALVRVSPAPDYLSWIQQVRQIACWANILRLNDAEAICQRWSASGVNAGPADARLIRDAIRVQSLEKLNHFAMAGTLLRDSGITTEIRAGRFGHRQPSHEDQARREAQRLQLQADREEALQASERQRQKASLTAVSLYNKANLDPHQSPYWQAKCSAAALPLPLQNDVRSANWRTYEKDAPGGVVYWNAALIVPLYRATGVGQIGMNTVELICGRPNPATALSFTGAKRGLKNAERSGCFYPIGLDKAEDGQPLVVCEGFASGVALSVITGGALPVICAMSCGNFKAVIGEISILCPSSPVFIVGDVGAGHQAAQAIAAKINRTPVYAVDLEPCLPEQDGADPFDLLARHGVENSRTLLRSLFREAAVGRDGTLSGPSSSDASDNI